MTASSLISGRFNNDVEMSNAKKDSVNGGDFGVGNNKSTKSNDAPQLHPQQPTLQQQQQQQQQQHSTSMASTAALSTSTTTTTTTVNGSNRPLVPKPGNAPTTTTTQPVQPDPKLKIGSKPSETGTEKRGPGRPPGSTKKNLEQQKGQQQQQSVQHSNGDLKGELELWQSVGCLGTRVVECLPNGLRFTPFRFNKSYQISGVALNWKRIV